MVIINKSNCMIYKVDGLISRVNDSYTTMGGLNCYRASPERLSRRWASNPSKLIAAATIR